MDPHSFIARAEAQRWLGISEKLLMAHDLVGSKTFAIRAQESDPRLEAAGQILAIADTLLAAEKPVVGNNGNQQPDFYAILQLDRFVQDTDHIASQYRRLAVMLNPHQNRFPYSDQAFQLVNDAWAVLSNPMQKSMYDSELNFSQQQHMNTLGFNIEEPEHQQHQHNFFSINQEQKLLEQQQMFEFRAQRNHQQQQLQQHNFLSQNPVSSAPKQEQPFQPSQITSSPPQPPLSWPQAPPQLHPKQEPLLPLQPQALPQHHQQQRKQEHHQQQLLRQQHHQQQLQEQKLQQEQERKLQQEQERKLQQEQQRKLQEEQQRKMQEEQQRKMQEEQQRKMQEEQRKLQQEHLEKQRIMQQEQERKIQQEQERKMKEEQQQKLQQEQLEKQQKLQQEQEQERQIQQEQERKLQEEQQREQQLKLQQEAQEQNAKAETETETETTDEKVDDSPTFWTTCPYCFHIYEYPKLYTDCTLRCDNCKRAFQAIRMSSPPPIIEGQNAYFYSWGYIPIGVSISHLQKNNHTHTTSNWTPFSPLYRVSKNVHNHLNDHSGPIDDETDDILGGISEPSDDSNLHT